MNKTDFQTAILGAVTNPQNNGEFCSLTAITVPAMNKTKNGDRKSPNPYLGRVLKYSRGEYQIGCDYEKVVNRRLKKQGLEPNFKVSHRSWGEWLVVNKIATHKGNFYVRVYLVHNHQVPPTVEWFLDGRLATPEEVADIKTYLKDKGESKKQSLAGLDKEDQVELREFNVEGIVRLSVKKTKFEVASEQWAVAVPALATR